MFPQGGFAAQYPVVNGKSVAGTKIKQKVLLSHMGFFPLTVLMGVGRIGAHSYGRHAAPDLVGFRGVRSCRDRISTGRIPVGSSNTIMYGENIGVLSNGQRQ